MTTKKSALDDFKLEYEDMEDKKQRIRQKASTVKPKRKTDRIKRPRKPSAFKMFFAYWAEVVLS